MKVKLVGVFERIDPDDEFWYGVQSDFSFKTDRWTIVPMFTTEEAIINSILRADTMVGRDGNTRYAISIAELAGLLSATP